jgi:hypothetical protein
MRTGTKLMRVVKSESHVYKMSEKSIKMTGRLYGKFWKLTLECGHVIEPYAQLKKPPKHAKCWYCLLKPLEGQDV